MQLQKLSLRFLNLNKTSTDNIYKGVTNPNQRDVRLRKPVFIIAKEFVKGLPIKSGMYSEFGMRPFSLTGVVSGLGQTKANYTEIGTYGNLDKDTARVCVERIIREMAEKVKNVTFNMVFDLSC